MRAVRRKTPAHAAEGPCTACDDAASSAQCDAFRAGPHVKALRLSTKGWPIKGRRVRITVAVRNKATLAGVRGASVRVSGAGVARRTKTSRTGGKLVFYVRATRVGRVTFRAPKAGFETA